MLKQLIVDLDPKDSLEAKLLLDYLAAADQQQWIKRCALVGYLVVTGQLQLADDQDDTRSSGGGMTPAAEAIVKKNVGNKLFGIK